LAEKQDPNDVERTGILIFIIILGLALIIGHFFGNQLMNILRWIRFSELWVSSLFLSDSYSVVIPVTWGGNGAPQSLGVWKDWLSSAPLDAIKNFSQIKAMSYIALMPMKIFFTASLAFMVIYTIFKDPGVKYSRKMDLEILIKEQAKSFPVIQPFIDFNPHKAPHRVIGKEVPRKLPLFAEALSPEEWVAFNQIKFENKQLENNKAYRAFAKQLGKRWEGPLKLPIYAQGIYAACALKHIRKRDACDDLINQLAISWSAKRGFKPSRKLRSKIKKIIKDPKIGGLLKEHADKHAFTVTVLLRCLAKARSEGGVMASATFLWLRGVDRPLWYALNNLGRQSYFTEASGAMVHYVSELISGQKIPVPQVETAVSALEEFINGPDGSKIPPLEPLKGKKK